ncbi:MAG: SBBP repeat-containing protein, partial [Candidatus Odinarchaeota archaeon]
MKEVLQAVYKKTIILSLVIVLVTFQPSIVLQIPSERTDERVKESVETIDQDVLKDLFPLSMTEKLQGPLPFAGFKENCGQIADQEIIYYYSEEDFWIGFGTKQVHYSLLRRESGEKVSFNISFAGAQSVNPEGVEQLSHYSHYFRGTRNITGIRSFREVRYKIIYPGIDLRFYQSVQGLKYDFIVHPGGRIEDITLEMSSDMQLVINPDEVIIGSSSATAGKITYESQLDVFYEEGGKRLEAEFTLKSPNSYGFNVRQENVPSSRNKAIIIDPLIFSTYLGGGIEYGQSIAVDSDGNCYITGYSDTRDFFVSKLSADGSTLLFSTYLGGSGIDT